MSKFAIGEKVDNAADDHEVGTVIAVFLTVDGSFRYAVDTEGYGALQFFAEEKLVIWNASSSHYIIARISIEESGCGEHRRERPANRAVGAECAGADVLGEASPPSPCCAVAI